MALAAALGAGAAAILSGGADLSPVPASNMTHRLFSIISLW